MQFNGHISTVFCVKKYKFDSQLIRILRVKLLILKNL